MEQILPGVWKASFGSAEPDTPLRLCPRSPHLAGLKGMRAAGECPLDGERIKARKVKRGMLVDIPLGLDEQIYGLGLQLNSFNQRKRKKMLRVNSDPELDLGDSHAPVPFYVSTAGYGVLVDTARYVTFNFGETVRKKMAGEAERQPKGRPYPPEDTFHWLKEDRGGPVQVEIPASSGVDLYIFGGPTLREAVQRYNLFSGGGCLPPRWGLGMWYRASLSFGQEKVLAMAAALRAEGMPCDVLGLEPGWQTHAYPCSHVWHPKFPDPAQMLERLDGLNYRANLWTHAFVHPTSPVYEDLYEHSGDHEVLGGLAPDLVDPSARQILGEHYLREHIDIGVSGYKLDECDNSDYNGIHWMFPESSQFPSGVDGEVMHSLYGVKFQEMILELFRRRGRRTYSSVRSSYALAAPLPFVLYSDLYNHRQFVRGVVNMGFSGLLWTPEVRDASSEEDLVRRMQAVVLSPQALVNAWYINNPPWKQWRRAENNRDEYLPAGSRLEEICRQAMILRMQLIPYLYAAFNRYHHEGIPPFRALVMDWPEDKAVRNVDDEWMIGDRLLAAPVTAGQSAREVTLPEGRWYDFWSGAEVAGGRRFTLEVPLDRIPLFVRGGAVLPLARATLHTADPASLELEARVYGDGAEGCELFEDDGTSLAHEGGAYNRLSLSWQAGVGTLARIGSYSGLLYRVSEWKEMRVA
jgi:alpha-D-xyloside xylohydrolase